MWWLSLFREKHELEDKTLRKNLVHKTNEVGDEFLILHNRGVVGWAYGLVRGGKVGQQTVRSECQQKYFLTVVPLGRQSRQPDLSVKVSFSTPDITVMRIGIFSYFSFCNPYFFHIWVVKITIYNSQYSNELIQVYVLSVRSVPPWSRILLEKIIVLQLVK
jgi:hypothetical protein